MTTDEGNLDYIELTRFLSSKENKRYAGSWVGVLKEKGKNNVVVTGNSFDEANKIIKQDYKRELGAGALYSIAFIPHGQGNLEVKIFMSGLQ